MAQDKASAPPVSAGDILKDRAEIGGTARSWDNSTNSKYRIHNLMYPSDLMAPPNSNPNSPPSATDAGSYVVFYLNVNVDSKLLKDKHEATVGDLAPGERIVGRSIQNANGSAVGVAATNAVEGIGISKVLSGGSSKLSAAGGLAGAVAVGAVATQAATFSREQKRLAAAIALHVPNQLTIRYGANWESEDTDVFSMINEGGEALVNAIKDMVAGGSAANAMREVKGPGSNIAASLGLKAAPIAVQGLTGLAPNPRKEQFFKGVDFRTFVFEYNFFPRDAAEAENVMNIIYMFKLHMHPEFREDGSFLYVYPSEFDITYFHNHKENLNIHRHTSCVLTELSMNYTPNGQYSTFENGMPTQITMSLTFKELGLITKELVQKGL